MVYPCSSSFLLMALSLAEPREMPRLLLLLIFLYFFMTCNSRHACPFLNIGRLYSRGRGGGRQDFDMNVSAIESWRCNRCPDVWLFALNHLLGENFSHLREKLITRDRMPRKPRLHPSYVHLVVCLILQISLSGENFSQQCESCKRPDVTIQKSRPKPIYRRRGISPFLQKSL